MEHKGKYSHVIPEYHRKLLNRTASGHFPVKCKRILKKDKEKRARQMQLLYTKRDNRAHDSALSKIRSNQG